MTPLLPFASAVAGQFTNRPAHIVSRFANSPVDTIITMAVATLDGR
jgi:hypothetical protein